MAAPASQAAIASPCLACGVVSTVRQDQCIDASRATKYNLESNTGDRRAVNGVYDVIARAARKSVYVAQALLLTSGF